MKRRNFIATCLATMPLPFVGRFATPEKKEVLKIWYNARLGIGSTVKPAHDGNWEEVNYEFVGDSTLKRIP